MPTICSSLHASILLLQQDHFGSCSLSLSHTQFLSVPFFFLSLFCLLLLISNLCVAASAAATAQSFRVFHFNRIQSRVPFFLSIYFFSHSFALRFVQSIARSLPVFAVFFLSLAFSQLNYSPCSNVLALNTHLYHILKCTAYFELQYLR